MLTFLGNEPKMNIFETFLITVSFITYLDF